MTTNLTASMIPEGLTEGGAEGVRAIGLRIASRSRRGRAGYLAVPKIASAIPKPDAGRRFLALLGLA